VDASVHPKNYDLSSLRLLGTVGEPINPEAWMWYYTQVGEMPDRRYLLADRDWRPHDHPAAGRHRWCRVRAPCRCRASWPRLWTSRAMTCRTGRAVFWSSSVHGRR
jgi:hypothetical protein